MNPVKVARVCNRPILTTYIELQVFRFIWDFSNIAKPFFNITGDNSTWI